MRCADSRLKTTMLSLSDPAAAESACSRVLAGNVGNADRQTAAFFRGLMWLLQVVQPGVAASGSKNDTPTYSPPNQVQLRHVLADIETAVRLEGPMRADALALRVTVNQVLGNSAQAQADIDKAIDTTSDSATPYVQHALEHKRVGDVAATLAALDRAVATDSASGTAFPHAPAFYAD